MFAPCVDSVKQAYSKPNRADQANDRVRGPRPNYCEGRREHQKRSEVPSKAENLPSAWQLQDWRVDGQYRHDQLSLANDRVREPCHDHDDGR